MRSALKQPASQTVESSNGGGASSEFHTMKGSFINRLQGDPQRAEETNPFLPLFQGVDVCWPVRGFFDSPGEKNS